MPHGRSRPRGRSRAWLTEECEIVDSLFDENFPLNYELPNVALDVTENLSCRDGLDENYKRDLLARDITDTYRLPRITLAVAGVFLLWTMFGSVVAFMRTWTPFRVVEIIHQPELIISLPSPESTVAYSGYADSPAFKTADALLAKMNNSVTFYTGSMRLEGDFAVVQRFTLLPAHLPISDAPFRFPPIPILMEPHHNDLLIANDSGFAVGPELAVTEVETTFNPVLCNFHRHNKSFESAFEGTKCSFLYDSYALIVLTVKFPGDVLPYDVARNVAEDCDHYGFVPLRLDFTVAVSFADSTSLPASATFRVPCILAN